LVTENYVSYADRYAVKHFKSSKDVSYSYDYNMCEIRFVYTLKKNSNIFKDTYLEVSPDFHKLKHRHDELSKAIEESLLFLDAPTVTPGKYTVVLDSKVVGVFAHESFGHKSEADFILKDEEAKKEWKIGKKIGSEILSIVDDGSIPDLSGYCPFDDEGTRAQKTYLIKNGKLAGRLHSLETSFEFNEAPQGNARALNFEFEPIVRMTTTYIEPGTTSFEELISSVDEGVYVKDYVHGSGLSTFTIAPKKSYYIRGGKIDTPVKVSVISGDVFQTLTDIEDCSDKLYIENMVLGGCGKIEQSPLPISCGGPAIKVKNMTVS
jgi:TldD protein